MIEVAAIPKAVVAQINHFDWLKTTNGLPKPYNSFRRIRAGFSIHIFTRSYLKNLDLAQDIGADHKPF